MPQVNNSQVSPEINEKITSLASSLDCFVQSAVCAFFVTSIALVIFILAYCELLLISAAVTVGLTGVFCLTMCCGLALDPTKNNNPINATSEINTSI